MTKKVKIIIGIVVLAVIITGALIAYNKLKHQITARDDMELSEIERAASAAEDNDAQKAIDFTMTDKDGNTIKLSDFIATGRPIVLNFWASWCPPCKVEMPEFDAVYKELGDEVQFIMLDLTDGQQETVEMGTAYVEEQGFSFPVFFDTSQEGASTYGIRSIPTTLFIDKDGYIISSAQGSIDESTLRKAIAIIR